MEALEEESDDEVEVLDDVDTDEDVEKLEEERRIVHKVRSFSTNIYFFS